MKYAPIFVTQTHISYANIRKYLCKHWEAQMEMLCHKTELAVPCEMLLRA